MDSRIPIRAVVAAALLAVVVALVAAVPGTSAGDPGGAEAQAAARKPCKDSRRKGLSQRRFRRAMQCLHNRARTVRGLKRLRGSRKLNLAAVAHARDMARRDYFDHCSPEDTTPTDRAQAKGYRGGAGENIITDVRRVRPVTLHRRWMKSSGHRSNILANFYEHLGFGIKREGRRLNAVAVFGFEADPALLQDTPCSQRTSG